ncbi:DEAD box ATP-dependent RNA helicase family member protein [Theileria equi strain WA]|uniref:ATP-dependent RNA helicase n=1 Tax=Theileria equi strain WA TaxID=1537102 RepID=L0AUL9_THEEQ|nr:DEAD box ATP-dependent RNA helicase family member protein [Theileria equi strain WA]AFZ79322.1 DEAD box ATP-dependent RNA helicase family member protein [Theileria equi strain WA]|eukprot:XP_004828988.1 DEAD box ATP-dependent RNA helicase family member protein [Theileria equi strain WA]
MFFGSKLPRLRRFGYLYKNDNDFKSKKIREEKSKNDDPVTKDSSDFSSLNLSQILVEWLRSRGITRMTKVQSLAITPLLQSGKDVLVQSRTGSGKTLCFVLPLLQLYMNTKGYNDIKGIINVFGLIVLPTRELAIQVSDIIRDSLSYIEDPGYAKTSVKTKNMFKIHDMILYCPLLIGGISIDNNVKSLNSAKEHKFVRSFLVATPGRLRHLMDMLSQEFVWSFKNLVLLILDEADRLLEMGYQNDMSIIFGQLPKQRRTGVYSATLSNGVKDLAKICLSNPVLIDPDSQTPSKDNFTLENVEKKKYSTPDGLNNYYILLNTQEKLPFVMLFIQYLKSINATKCVLFFLSCDLVDYYFDILKGLSLYSNPFDTTGSKLVEDPCVTYHKIHRKLTTKKRQQSFNAFKAPSVDTNGSNKNLHVLLCTDLFSRGIDIPKIDWIIQFDPPQDPNFYVHRIGRVCRADNTGNALLFLTPNEESYIQFQLNRNIRLTKLTNNILDPVLDIVTSISSEKILPFLLNNNVDVDTRIEDGTMTYSEYLKQRPLPNPVLPWDITAMFLSYLRSYISTDRKLLLSASKAFVSYAKSYSEHRLKLIFEINKFDYGSLATSMGVLRIPRIKEILGRKMENFMPSNIIPNSVPFKDKKLELERLKKMEETPKIIKPKEKKQPAPQKSNRTRSQKRMTKKQNSYDEWLELSKEESLVKKLKKRKITYDKFEKLLNNEESDWEQELDNFVRETQTSDNESYKKWISGGKRGRKKR